VWTGYTWLVIGTSDVLWTRWRTFDLRKIWGTSRLAETLLAFQNSDMYGVSQIQSGMLCYNEQSYNERMLQRTFFNNKIRMLQPKRRNTIGRRSTHLHMTCRAFRLWLERQSSSLLSFVRFSYQFSSVVWLFAPLAVKFFRNILLYNFSHEPAK